MFDLTTNADALAEGVVGVVVEAARTADEEAADLAYDLVNPRTPRRTGRLAAGLRSVVASNGFDLVDAVPYATPVDARTGFATSTILAAEQDFAAIYDKHLQDRFDRIEP